MGVIAEVGAPLVAVFLSVVVFIEVYRWRGLRARKVTHDNSIPLLEEEEEEEIKNLDDGDLDLAASDDTAKIKVKCFFGSQTGTAENFAKQLAKDLTTHGFVATAIDLEETDQQIFCEKDACGKAKGCTYHVYFMATYGEGDPTDNAIEFIEYIKKDSEEGGPEENSAIGVKFGVFALGNSQYENYNNIGKTVRERLLALGGTELYPLGLGDDDKDIEEDFNAWKDDLLEAFLKDAFNTGSQIRASEEAALLAKTAKPIPEFHAKYITAPKNKYLRACEGRKERDDKSAALADLSSRHFFQATCCKVVESRALGSQAAAKAENKETLHLEIEIGGSPLKYETADTLSICPENDAELVSAAARYLGLDLNQWFKLSSTNDRVLFPTPCTVRTALTYYTDLSGLPSRSFLDRLASFVSIAAHSKRLRFLASKDGSDEYHHYVSDRQLSVLEVFETFPSVKLSEENLGEFFEVLPRLKARDYTISSSSLVQPNRISITVGVIRKQKNGGLPDRFLDGVCSSYLKRCHLGMGVYCFVKKSTFSLPKDPSLPLILVGPGTGIAPFRAFLQERDYIRAKHGESALGKCILFFGCRSSTEDFIYENELKDAARSGLLTALYTAFSREQKDKVYVQHVMAEEGAYLWRLLDRGAHVYVCGATSMGKDVHETLARICLRKGGFLRMEESKAYLHELQKEGRYVAELWSS